MITVLVGQSKKPYNLHAELLKHSAPYFATRLKDCWDGKTAEPILLQDVDECGFNTVIDWIYTRQLPQEIANPGAERDNGMADAAYKAADVLMISDLQNALIDNELRLLEGRMECWHLKALKTKHDLGIGHTPYYQLVLRHCVRTIMGCDFLDQDPTDDGLEILTACPEALKELAQLMRAYHKQPFGPIWEEDWCQFHVHPDGKRCKKV